MLRADSPAELLSAPIGRYVAGRSFVVWVESPERLGAFQFGPLDSSDNPALAALFPLPSHPALAQTFDVLHDVSAVEVIDRSAFDFLEGFLEMSIEQLAGRIRRFAVVRPGGLAGAAVAGLFYEWVAPHFDSLLCGRRSEAHAWLGNAEDTPARIAIDELYERFLPSTLLRRVRETIARSLADATLTSVAQDLGLTPRTLQRHLASEGSSFSDEVNRARMRHAEAMLLDGNDKIELIARELGFQSTAAFTGMFHRFEGEPPSAFRARRRHGRTGRRLRARDRR
jgi:AraC-like DNA-binding protein